MLGSLRRNVYCMMQVSIIGLFLAVSTARGAFEITNVDFPSIIPYRESATMTITLGGDTGQRVTFTFFAAADGCPQGLACPTRTITFFTNTNVFTPNFSVCNHLSNSAPVLINYELAASNTDGIRAPNIPVQFTCLPKCTDGEIFHWSGEAGDNNWHTEVGDETNWNDDAGVTIDPPGCSEQHVVNIKDNIPQDGIVIDQQDVNIGSLNLSGNLIVNKNLTIQNGGTLSGGSLEVATGATIDFRGSDTTETTVTGNISAKGDGNIRISGGNFTVGKDATVTFAMNDASGPEDSGLFIDGGTLSGAGKVVNKGCALWLAGTISLTGGFRQEGPLCGNNFIIKGSGSKNLGGVFEVDDLHSNVRHEADASVTFSGATLNIEGNFHNVGNYNLLGTIIGGDDSTINNKGQFRVGGMEKLGTIGTRFNNTGSLSIGTDNTFIMLGPVPQLDIDSGTLMGGSWSVSSGAILTIGDTAIIENNASVNISGNGQFNNLPVVGPGLDFNNRGSLHLSSGAKFNVDGNFTNTGTVFLLFTGTELNINGNCENVLNFFLNEETTCTVTGEFSVREFGTRTEIDGTLTAGSLGNGVGSLLKGKGTVNGNIVNDGTVEVGNSPGTLTINGDYTQTANGTLAIELGGTESGQNLDQLVVTGNAILGGKLVFKFIDDLSPQVDQTFDFLAVNGTQTGAFENVLIEDLADGFEFDITETSSGLIMTATSNGVFNGILGEINDIDIGFSSPQAETIANPGDGGVPMLQFELVPGGNGVTLSGITLSSTGSGNDASDLTVVTLWVDQDRDGQVDFEGVAIATGTYDADNGTLQLTIDPPYEVSARETVTLLITYDITPAVTNPAAITRSIGNIDSALASGLSNREHATMLPLMLATALFSGIILSIGLVSKRNFRTKTMLFSVMLSVTMFICCTTGVTNPNVNNSTFGTFKVMLNTINATELGTNIDASVEDLSLTGTTLTVRL